MNHHGLTQVHALIGAFVASSPGGTVDGAPALDIWRDYPDVSIVQDRHTDSWACARVARAFAEFAPAEASARLVTAEESGHGDVDAHVWTRVGVPGGTFDVDFTARQYHNLADKVAAGRVLAARWPLVWSPAGGASADARVTVKHPILGVCRRVCVVGIRD